MKVKFTKLAALLLAGVALFATGCTDYEVDIQKVDKKVDNLTTEVNNKIASLEQQIAGINATIATLETKAAHDADIQTLRNELAQQKADLQNEFNGKIEKAVADLTAEINKKVNQADYDVDKAKIEKAIKDVNDALDAAKGRIKALEDADYQGQIDAAKDRIKALEDAQFQDQIDAAKGRITKLENLLAGDWDGKTVKETIDAVAQSVADLETAVNGKINALEVRVKANEDAIKEINEKTIPALQAQIDTINKETIPALKKDIQDLKDGKLDKATFEEYKTATANTIRLMQEAIQNLADTKLDKTEFETKVAEILAKFDDYVLKTTFEAFKAIVGTEDELKNFEGTIIGRLKACEALLAGEWGDKTVKEYIDAEAKKLQDQLDLITNKDKTGRLDVLEQAEADLEKLVKETILPQVEFALDYVGDYGVGLQGYIDEGDAWALEEAKKYTDSQIKLVMETVYDLYYELYDVIQQLASRIQSIVYVPDYDDLKITSNMAAVTQEGVEGVMYMDQPTEVTYKILPAMYAAAVADNFEDLLAFDVKTVKTRADEDAPVEPAFQILKAEKDANIDENGLVTFTVLPVNVASAAFAATDIPVEFNAVFGNVVNVFGFDIPYLWADGEYVYPVVKEEDLEAYLARTAFAASLRFVNQDVVVPSDHREGDVEYSEEYNEVASTYNVLFPAVSDKFDIGVYKPVEDEEGNTKLVAVGEEWQKLPYTSLREATEDYAACVGEPKNQDPKGYRIIQDGAIPGIVIEGKDEPMTLEEATAAGYVVPTAEISFDEFTYFKNKTAFDAGSEGNVDEKLFIPTEKVYAEIEMNPEKTPMERKAALGNVISGNYKMTTAFGVTEFDGQVEIVKPQGEVAAEATIVWTYALDAEVDHNLFYGADGATTYTRVKYPVKLNEEDVQYIFDNLPITFDDFEGVNAELKVTMPGETEDDDPVDVTDKFIITHDKIVDNGLVVDFEFPGDLWDKVFTVTAVYHLDVADITVNGVVTTVDRNREKVVLGPYEHTFVVNDPEEYYDGYYHWTSDPLYGDIFKAFNDEHVINLELNEDGDFEYDAEKEEFAVAELEGKLKAAKDAGTAKGYIDIKNAEDVDVYAWTMKTVTPEVLAGDIFSSGKRDENDPNLWLGNTVTRNITTYIGEEVEFSFIFNYKVPDYNFLHLSYYTFNTDESQAVPENNFIQHYDLDEWLFEEQVKTPYDAPLWWSQVQPSYFNAKKAEGTNEADAQQQVSNRYALADYDVKYINLAELAFNVVDENDEIIDNADLAALGLEIKFEYKDSTKLNNLTPEEIAEHPDWEGKLPVPDQKVGTPEFLLYKSLWVDNTTFYYLTNEHPWIPARGVMTLTVGTVGQGGYKFPVATRFDFAKDAAKYEGVTLDYSNYAMVRWTPFQKGTADGFTIVLDENKIYAEPLFKGMNLKDRRPHDTSFFVIQDGKWVEGNAAADATAASNKNGYLTGVNSKEAYHIEEDFDYNEVELPAELRKIMKIKYSADGVTFVDKEQATDKMVPYIYFDYTSEVEFRGEVVLNVLVKLQNPWQEELVFNYDIKIKGVR